MILMNKDIPVLEFDLEDMYIHIINNQFLPYVMKDYIQDTNPLNFKKSIRDIDILRDFLSGRMLSISRENAKILLNVLALPQTLKTEERVKISLMCRALSMTDNFWVKGNAETLSFADVNLRTHKLSEASYQVSILGRHISACLEDLKSDVMTNGMFAKTWRRHQNKLELWKTDKTNGNINAKAEVEVSHILDTSNIPHIQYHQKYLDDYCFAVCQCFTNDDISFVTAQDMKDYCSHINQSFHVFLQTYFTDFANMTILDYCIANTDRHFENWGFLVDNTSNEIISFAPLFDHNQALIADMIGTQIDTLIYEPTGLTFQDSIKQYAIYSNLSLDTAILSDKCLQRYQTYSYLKDEHLHEYET